MKTKSTILIVTIFTFALFLSSPVAGAVKTLKAVSMLPVNHPMSVYVKVWVEKINKLDPTNFQINYVGGPEVIPATDQAEAVRKGVAQIAFTPTAYYAPMIPEADVFTLSQYTPWEERTKASGFYDLMVKCHEKINVHYVGRWLYSPFHLWFREPFKSLTDLKGRRMRTLALHDRYMRELEMVPVSISHGDTFTALERGTVQGFGWPMLGPRDYGWANYGKYILDPEYLNQNSVILINLDIWKGFTPDMQKKIEEITINYEKEMVDYFKKEIEKEREILKNQVKAQFITLPYVDANKFITTVEAIEWGKLKEKVPNLYEELRKVSIKR